MKLFKLLVACLLVPVVASAAEIRIYELRRPQAEDAKNRTSAYAGVAEELLAQIGKDGVTLRNFAVLPASGESRREVDRTYTLSVPGPPDERGRPTDGEELKVGMLITLEETADGAKLVYDHSEVEQWIRVGNHPDALFPVVRTRRFETDLSRIRGRFLTLDGLTDEGYEIVLIVERVPAAAEAVGAPRMRTRRR